MIKKILVIFLLIMQIAGLGGCVLSGAMFAYSLAALDADKENAEFEKKYNLTIGSELFSHSLVFRSGDTMLPSRYYTAGADKMHFEGFAQYGEYLVIPGDGRIAKIECHRIEGDANITVWRLVDSDGQMLWQFDLPHSETIKSIAYNNSKTDGSLNFYALTDKAKVFIYDIDGNCIGQFDLDKRQIFASKIAAYPGSDTIAILSNSRWLNRLQIGFYGIDGKLANFVKSNYSGGIKLYALTNWTNKPVFAITDCYNKGTNHILVIDSNGKTALFPLKGATIDARVMNVRFDKDSEPYLVVISRTRAYAKYALLYIFSNNGNMVYRQMIDKDIYDKNFSLVKTENGTQGFILNNRAYYKKAI